MIRALIGQWREHKRRIPGRSQPRAVGVSETTPTTTAVVGLGNMGCRLARRLAGRTDFVLTARDEGEAAALASPLGAASALIDTAIAAADIVLLALPYEAALAFAAPPISRAWSS